MKMFAVETSDIGGGVDDNYSTGDQCKYVIARPGDEIQALLKNGQTVVVGDLLVSDGTGALQKYVAETESNRIDMTKTDTTVSFTNTIYDTTVVGIALEAMTASGASKILIEVA
jgi:hypothetical protein